MKTFKQSAEWERLFQNLIRRAKDNPSSALYLNNHISPETVANASDNHVFDNNYDFWGITEQEAHSIRRVFLLYSIDNADFKSYIRTLIMYA